MDPTPAKVEDGAALAPSAKRARPSWRPCAQVIKTPAPAKCEVIGVPRGSVELVALEPQRSSVAVWHEHAPLHEVVNA
jgi:hypothetical protein